MMHLFMFEVSACVQCAMTTGDLTSQQAAQVLAYWHRFLIHPKPPTFTPESKP